MSTSIIDSTDLLVVFQTTDGSNQLMVSSYNNDEEEWSAEAPLISGLQACNPAIATYEGIFYVAYQPWSGKVVGQLYVAASEDGTTWTTNSNPVATNIGGFASTMTEFRDALYNIYQEINTGRLCIIYSNDGIEWSAPAYISNYITKTNPSVTVMDGVLYLVYQTPDSLQLVITTTEDCLNWTTPSPLFSGMQACNPSITSFEGKLYVAYQPWNQKVVGQLYVASYGNGINWQHSTAPIVPNMGGCAASIAVYNGTLEIVYQEMNTARLCITSSEDGSTWATWAYISDYATITLPAAKSTLRNEIRRKLEESGIVIKAKSQLPDPFQEDFFHTSPDADYNWEHYPSKVENGWGLTGIVNWQACETATDPALQPGTIFIFPGNRNTEEMYNKEYPNDGYQGQAMINGKSADPIYFQAPNKSGSLHGQLCNLIKPEGIDLIKFMQNFLGFAYDGQTLKMKFNSNALNSLWFYLYDTNKDTTVKKTFMFLSEDWELSLKGALDKYFQ
ncbi:hypothetical protein F0919_07875 [Taibaiella lutea]|uniref:Uncharacterized protein n=1 Tax=Taibaiella lutea TaxID=2608001 RepID=A0A5M6CJA1_9BACT|nr:exo-alpha-sialidase [Taibaiella lutea]KAA5534530.1 hypothetical protein F0919_07875 [Taibaiella lutea]